MLGPLVYRIKPARPAAARAWAAAAVAAWLGLLVLAGALEPDPAGFGTHRKLGLYPCSMPLTTGYPCPTCGMTTAFAHAVRGQWIRAFRAQPAGLALCLGVVAAAGLALSVVVSGTAWRVNWYRIPTMWLMVTAIGLLLAGWGYKIVAGLLDGSLPVR